MKNIVTLILLLSVTCLYSQHINIEHAKLAAKNFYYERVNSQQHTDYNNIVISDILEEKVSGQSIIYVVDFESEGFVILSGIMNAKPVLGYSFHGVYNNISLPPQFRDWLDQYILQIEYLSDHPEIKNNENQQEWKRLQTNDPEELIKYNNKDIEPMLTSTWDQGIYYNEQCPADPAGPGGHCVTGCVATALGQLVNYFRWPVTGLGSYSYECPPYGTLSANFGETTYLWDEMALNLTNSNPAVATLLSHLGISVDMVYGPNGSGMYNHKAAYTLRTFFKYDSTCTYVYRDSTNMDWDSLLVTNLDKHIPMYYAGWSVPNISGHAFIVDGYQSGNYYHFNWGWGGSYDGYFYTNALNPGGSNFNLAQELVINAVPDTNLYSYPVYCNGADTVYATDGTIDDGSGPLHNYTDNAACSWLIAPDDSVNTITIHFLEFETDNDDILSVYDGEDNGAPLLGQFSGSSIPEDITSTGDSLYLEFVTDNNTNETGWMLTYTSEIPVYCSGMLTLTDEQGSFSDGSGPRDYHNNTNCIWLIDPPYDADILTIEVVSFQTEAEHDVLKIFDYDSQELLCELSGDTLPPGPIYVESNKAFITFSTNITVTAPGWEIFYYPETVGLHEKEESLTVELYPNPAKEYVILKTHSPQNQQIGYTIYDNTGRELFHSEIAQGKGVSSYKIDLAAYEKGIYFIRIETKKNQLMRKIILN